MYQIDEVTATPFFDRPNVQTEQIPIGPGIPLGIERISNPEIGIAGVYGTWGESYDNTRLIGLIEGHLGKPLEPGEQLNLAELGFENRHHLPGLTDLRQFDEQRRQGEDYRTTHRACHQRSRRCAGKSSLLDHRKCHDKRDRIRQPHRLSVQV